MKKLLFILFYFTVYFSFSQNGKNFGEISHGKFETDIDYNLYRCISDSTNIVAQCNCYVKSSKDWQSEIDKYSKIILSKLQKKAKDDFQTSIEAWKKYRESEIELAYSIYRDVNEDRIDMFRYYEKMVDLNRKRAFELKQYGLDMNLINY